MRSQLRIVLVTLLFAGVWSVAGRVSETVTGWELFRVRDVDVRGLDLASRDEIVERLRLTSESSVWEDPEVWIARLEGHPMLKEVRVGRRVPGTLVIDVVERRPVALAPTPTLEPVDAEGKRLPVDPAERTLDLPVLEVFEPVPDALLLRTRGRALAAEVARLTEADIEFAQMVSELSWMDATTVVARWTEPRVDFLFFRGTPPHRLRQGLSVLADALSRDQEESPRTIDLRFADQVVVRRTR
jgi:cell division protein FtsQ